VGKLSGAVGTYSNIDPRVEEMVCQKLGLRPLPSTQVIARDAHAQALNAIAQFGGTIEQFALEVRLLSRSDVGEMSEFFAAGQKGSSAMPHKRNPIMSERLCGMSRVLRGYAVTGMENVALWHERDISHSSAERIIFPDAISLVLYMARRAALLVNTVEIHSDRAMKNLLADSHGSVFSQSLLLALISMGEERELAYRTVQELSARALENDSTLQELAYELDLPEVTYDQVFSLNRLLAHRERFLSALTWRA
jgi:adenylosuccinate lyase